MHVAVGGIGRRLELGLIGADGIGHLFGEAWFDAKTERGFPLIVARDASGIAGFGTFGEFRAWPGYRHSVEHSVHVRAPLERTWAAVTKLARRLAERPAPRAFAASVPSLQPIRTAAARTAEGHGRVCAAGLGRD